MSTMLDRQVLPAISATPSAECAPLLPIGEAAAKFQREARHLRLSSPRYQISVSEIGSGPPLVIVQGMCSNRVLFAALAVSLAATHRVLVYDLPGIQPEDQSNLTTYGPDEYIADLEFVLDAMDAPRSHIMGNSFGTTIVQRALLAIPERFERAMLVCGFAYQPISLVDQAALYFFGNRTDTMGDIPMIAWKSRHLHHRELERREAGLTDFLLNENNRTPIPTVVHQAYQVQATDLRPYLSQIQTPVLVAHGKDDRLISPKRSVELVDGIPNAELVLIPRCGHIPHLSHPEYLSQLAERYFRPE